MTIELVPLEQARQAAFGGFLLGVAVGILLVIIGRLVRIWRRNG